MSARLLNSIPFRFMRWKFGLVGSDAAADRAIEALLVSTIQQTPKLDAAVALAFDGVYDALGNFIDADTHFYVTNDYVIELARDTRKSDSAHRSIPIDLMRWLKLSDA